MVRCLRLKVTLRGAIEAGVGDRCYPRYRSRTYLSPTSIPISRCSHLLGSCSVCGSVSQTISAYQCPSALCTRCTLLGNSLDRTVQLDLEEVSQFLRDNEVFLVLVQIAVFAVLSQLDGMPSVRLLEAWETHTRNIDASWPQEIV